MPQKYCYNPHTHFFLPRNSPNRAYLASLLKFSPHTQTHTHTVGLLWMNDQSIAEAATYTTHNKHARRIFMAVSGTRTRDLSKPGAAQLPLTSYSHCDPLSTHTSLYIPSLSISTSAYNQYIYIIISSIQPEGRFWQEPEPSQASGMALAHCILGSFLGVGCHCFPPPLDVPTFASRCLHVQAT